MWDAPTKETARENSLCLFCLCKYAFFPVGKKVYFLYYFTQYATENIAVYNLFCCAHIKR